VKEPIPVVSILLQLSDGRLALQRRDKKAKNCPEMLNTFGGHIDDNELPEAAARRELSEETSLPADELDFEYLFTYKVPANKYINETEKVFAFRVKVEDANFEVHEGEGMEIYKFQELFKRKDLTPVTQVLVKKLKEDPLWH
jgi:8-oxo-dGTP pyrophosphatase MutT (NUDIX family)